MKSINNYKTFLITMLLVLGIVSQAINAQNAAWRYATVLPGSTIKATLRPVFSDCYTVETYFQKDWYNCKDTKGLHKMNWNSVWNKVHKEADFTISKPGYLYIRFDSKIPKGVFYYGKPTIAISKIGKDKKWHSVWIGGSVYTPIQKQQYRISPDGTLKYYGVPPQYEAGQYKVTVVSATRNNPNKAERVFVPSSANAKVYFVADGSKVTTPKPKIDNKFTFGKNWHVSERNKIGLAKIVQYIRARANDLINTNEYLAAKLMTYAWLLEGASIYHKKKSFLNPSGEASTSFLSDIYIYDAMTQHSPFETFGLPITDNKLGIAASLLIHEMEHALGNDEWAAHDIQRKTYEALRINKDAYIRKNIKHFFERYPKPSIWVKFYWLFG